MSDSKRNLGLDLAEEYDNIKGIIKNPTKQSELEHNSYIRLQYEYDRVSKTRNACVKKSIIALLASSAVCLLLSLLLDNKLSFLSIWIISILLIVAYMINTSYKHYKLKALLGIDDKNKKEEEK